MTKKTWKQYGKDLIVRVPLLRSLVHRAYAWSRAGSFKGSSDYWERRYAAEGSSGSGSYGRLAQFKADVLNDFVRKNSIRTVIELGCGDGNQLTLMDYKVYAGVDVSPTAVSVCRGRFADRRDWQFIELGELERIPGPFDLSLSLDVIYHLVEDSVFEQHLEQLFTLSNRFVVIYSTNHEDEPYDAHVRHRKFTSWISAHRPDWVQIGHVANVFPFDPSDPDNTSDAGFFMFARKPA